MRRIDQIYYFLINLKTLIFYNKTYRTAKEVSLNGFTYLDKYAILNLINSIIKIQQKKVKGIWVEAGTALGGSAIIISSLKSKNQTLHLFDTFTQIPSPDVKDGADVHLRYKEIVEGKAIGINNDPYYGYIEDLLLQVKDNFAKSEIDTENIVFHKGLFTDTMQFSEKIAFAHIDCDWYESVKYCLNEVIPNLQNGGIVIIDDYDHWSGCKLAVDEFINTYSNIDKYKITHNVRFKIEKVR